MCLVNPQSIHRGSPRSFCLLTIHVYTWPPLYHKIYKLVCASIPCANLCGRKININMPPFLVIYICFFFLLCKTLKADNSQINSNPDLVSQYFSYPVHFKQLLIKYALIFVKMCLYLHVYLSFSFQTSDPKIILYWPTNQPIKYM